MTEYLVADLNANTYVKYDLILDPQFLVMTSATRISQELLDALNEWQFERVFGNEKTSSKQPKEESKEEVKKEDNVLTDEHMAALENQESVTIDNDNAVPVGEESEGRAKLKKTIAHAHEKRSKTNIRDAANTEKSRMEMISSIYYAYFDYFNWIFNHYATHKTILREELMAIMQEFVQFIKDNRRYVLRVPQKMEDGDRNFMVTHAIRTTVLALTISNTLRMPPEKQVELGMATVLHEIGQLRLPKQLYSSARKLSMAERTQLSTHTILGYNIVKDAGFPLSVQLGVLEHHENENGMGYPRRLRGDKISLYSKIISVACSYEAITAPRSYKTERSTYDAMVEMLKNQNGKYDEMILKALLYSVSLYPIGAYVYLSNGQIGQVTDSIPGSPRNPLVQIIGETEQDGSPKNVPTNETNLKIIRVMDKNEVSDVLAAMAK